MFFYGYWNHSEQSYFSKVPMVQRMPFFFLAPPPVEVNILYPRSTNVGIESGLVVDDDIHIPRSCIRINENNMNVNTPVALFGTISKITQDDPAYNFVSPLPSTTITGKWIIKDAVAPKTPAASALPMSFTVDGVQCYALGNSKVSYTDDSDIGAIVSLYFPHNTYGYWQTHDFGYLQLDYTTSQYSNEEIAGGFTRFTDDNGRVLSDLVGKVIDFGDSITDVPLYFYEYISSIASPYEGVTITIRSWNGVDVLSRRIVSDPVRKVSFGYKSYQYKTRGIGIWTTTMGNGSSPLTLLYEEPTEDKEFLGWSTVPRASVATYEDGEIIDVTWDCDTTIYEVYIDEKPPIDTITVQLYRNTAENNRVDKTSYLTTLGTHKGSLRASCDVLNPTIVIQSDYLPSSNYMFIKEFGNRWYFVDGWRIITTGLYELTASVDVLMTYKEQILELEAVVGRNEFQREPLLTDETYLILPTYTIEEYRADTIFDGVNADSSEIGLNAVIIIGGKGDIGIGD